MAIEYPKSDGAIRALHELQIATAVIECRDFDGRDLCEAMEYLAAMFRPVKPKRGGEPAWRTEARSGRDDDYRGLARQMFGEGPITEPQARIIEGKVRRYRPTSEEPLSPERQHLQRIATSGLKAVQAPQILKIVNGKTKT